MIVNEGVELNLTMVKQLHEFFLAHLHSPFSLLINKINAYSYDFEAQINIGNLSEIHAIAVIVYKIASQLNTEYLANTIPRADKWNLRIYSDRDVALNWLQLEQAQVS
ncbi:MULTISPECIES: hypothetical protein [Colwellia]|uniref:STAS/SEC14 domain-containing protein n=1 Tax=Colwellia marinimaniae TaxID=1513592 RepID=A0ABQ0MX86_9GAMM|nr:MULTISPECIES: hypothetical protein [Colwellia]GAW96862.1 hypothetical protein MTCD1_02485 [Colwellia marinimaniae]